MADLVTDTIFANGEHARGGLTKPINFLSGRLELGAVLSMVVRIEKPETLSAGLSETETTPGSISILNSELACSARPAPLTCLERLVEAVVLRLSPAILVTAVANRAHAGRWLKQQA